MARHAAPLRTVRCQSSAATKSLRSKIKQDAAISIKDLKVQFTRKTEQSIELSQVLKGVGLDIKRGTLHMLLGPNGCGKSTLLKVLGGLVTPSSGTFQSDSPTGFVFQNPDHQVVMPTVAADVAFGLGRYDMPEAEVQAAVSSALEVVNMSPYMHRATHTLSGGQRQRVAIAGALAENPRILLLDELTTFLDMEDQFGVLQAVKRVTRSGSAAAASAPSDHSTASNAEGAASSTQGEGASVSDSDNSSSKSSRGEDSLASSSSQGNGASGSGQERGVAGNGWVMAQTSSESESQEDSSVTAIWVTHRFEELEYADAASYMQDGRVVYSGTPAEMRAYLKKLGAPL